MKKLLDFQLTDPKGLQNDLDKANEKIENLSKEIQNEQEQNTNLTSSFELQLT